MMSISGDLKNQGQKKKKRNYVFIRLTDKRLSLIGQKGFTVNLYNSWRIILNINKFLFENWIFIALKLVYFEKLTLFLISERKINPKVFNGKKLCEIRHLAAVI